MIYLGITFTYLFCLYFLFRHGNMKMQSEHQVGAVGFFAILFTTGLDGGLILLPQVDFITYSNVAVSPEYAFSNPLAIEFGFWGGLIWLCYFVTTCYFAIYEPRLKLFDKPLIKYLNNALVILTCAFSAWLLFSTLSQYLPIDWLRNFPYVVHAIILAVILCSVFSSSRIYYIKYLSIVSLLLFILLIFVVGWQFKLNESDVLLQTGLLLNYFVNMDKFILPINDYHQFYYFWWLAWSIMIGQFTAKFVNGIKVYQLFICFLILPSIPIAIWFLVLHQGYQFDIALDLHTKLFLALMGVLYVMNSMDSMIRLYSVNLGINKEKLGNKKYYLFHSLLLMAVASMFEVQMLNIEAVGSIILVLWAVALSYCISLYQQPKLTASNKSK